MDNIEEKYFLTRGKAILAGLILIIFMVILIAIKTGGKNSEAKYKDFENELKVAAENYVDITEVEIDDGEEKRLWMKDILKVYSTDNELKDKCNGYVIMSSDKDISTEEYEITYRAYIKCGKKYITKSYSEY